MTKKEMAAVVADALSRLSESVERLIAATFPHTDLPRLRVFCFAPSVRWPYISEGKPDYRMLTGKHCCYSVCSSSDLRHTASVIVDLCEGRPRAVLRAVRRIEAAADWCARRVEGRRRAAMEILRQQQGALRELEARAVLVGLSRASQK